MNQSLRSFLTGVFVSASIPLCVADDVTTTYLLVTDDYQIDLQSRYIIAAKDHDVMAGKSESKNSKWGLTEAPFTRNPDNSITVVGEHLDSRFYFKDAAGDKNLYSDDYHWRLCTDVNGAPLTTSSSKYELSPKYNFSPTIKYFELLITFESDGSTNMKFPAKYYIRYFEGEKRFRCAGKNEQELVCLYREDRFGFKLDETYNSTDEILITSIWKYAEDKTKEYPMKVWYMFNDGTEVTKDQLMTSGKSINPEDPNRILIPHSSEDGSVLWIMGCHEPLKDVVGTEEFYIYGHVCRLDIPAPANKITGPEHFTQPKTDGYKFKDTVVFTKDDDVKIYYTLDGSDPKLPSDSENNGGTFDLDIAPIVYLGDKIELKFVAVKDGYEPTDVITLVITGESKPVTTEGVHFKAPVSKDYEVNEPIVFERDDDVKIYYTLDGLEPVIPETVTIDNESEPQNGDDSSQNPEYVTYDLDETPLVFNGSSLYVRYVALKKDYVPSIVHTFEIKMPTSGIDGIEDADDLPAIYYNLQGAKVEPPLRPGLYIILKGEKATKVVVR